MAITTADKFEYDVPVRAKAKSIPPSALKELIRKLFSMAPFGDIPDKLYFVEEAKAYEPVVNAKGETLAVHRDGRLLLNGDGTIIIGLKAGEGSNQATLETYMFKAAKSVYDLSTWIA